MELFAPNKELAALEAALLRAEGADRLVPLIALAWQLRQRDCGRSLVLADEAEVLLGGAGVDTTERRRGLARLRLVRGEVAWLFADLDAAEHHADAALAAFDSLGDRIGAGDGKWLLASIVGDRGNVRRRDECVTSAIEDYRAAGDPVRVDAATARSLLYAAFGDPGAAASRLVWPPGPAASDDAAVTAWAACARAIAASPAGGFGNAARHFLEAHHAAVESGQIRQAVLTASNAADSFAILGDLDTALEWDEIALTLARGAGWPSVLGNSLMQTGNVLRLLGRHAESEVALREALAVRAALKDSNGYAITLCYLGDLALDVGDPAAALEYFGQAEERARTPGGRIPLSRCWRGQAHALCRLARPEEARARLAAALELATAEGSPDEQIDTLRVYAELHRTYPLPPPDGMVAASATLHYLNQAMALAANISGYTPRSELLFELASACAACGDHRLAYDHALAAAGVRDSKRFEQARNRAMAMQGRQGTERARVEAGQQRQLAESERVHTEAEHQRQTAATEASRARTLQEASATLQTLGQIGREITASLNIDEVFAALFRHASQLFDVTSFSVYLLEPDGRVLKDVFSIELGQRLPSAQIPIDDPNSITARCARSRQDLFIAVEPDTVLPTHIPGTVVNRTLLFTPLMIGERLLGVMSIESIKAHAYGERERSIFRTLCAYGAIALDNATAHALVESARQQAHRALVEMRQAQEQRTQAEAARASLEAQLRESQKMEALGTLAGGVAHDFNNALAAITGNVELARQDVGPGHPALESLDEIGKASRRAKDLVEQILAFGRRQKLERTVMSLALVVVETERLLRATLPVRVRLSVECAGDTPAVLADSTQVKQILLNLCNNALHAVEDQERPGVIEVRLEARHQPDDEARGDSGRGRCACLTVRDNGSGMDEATRARIFEPFFTTKPRGRGTGLGLSVVYGIVQAHGASMTVKSTPGEGSEFRIYFPPAEAPIADVVPPVAAAAPVHGKGKHVLYVDDEEAIIFLMKRLLERQGFRVSGYTDPHEALAAVRLDPDQFDLAVTDYSMPGMSGLEVAQALRELRPDLPMVLASGYITEELRARAPAAGIRELIYKPNTVEDLCAAVARVAQTVGGKAKLA